MKLVKTRPRPSEAGPCSRSTSVLIGGDRVETATHGRRPRDGEAGTGEMRLPAKGCWGLPPPPPGSQEEAGRVPCR